MNKKEIRNQNYCLMETFIMSYIGINDKKITKELLKLNHKDFKEYCRMLGINLTCVPFEFVTKEDIENGDILLVADKKRCVAPYKNPIKANFNSIMEEETERQIEKIYKVEENMQTFDDYIDDLDEIALDKGINNQKIKVLSKTKYKGSGK